MDHKTEEEKKAAFYSSLMSGWLETKLEKDKSILMLSAGGIGLLITLLTAIGIPSVLILLLYGFALIAFILTLFLIIKIFDKNGDYLKSCAVKEEDLDKPNLSKLDKWVMIFFITGICFSFFIGVTTGISSLSRTKGNKMAFNENEETTVPNEEKSFNGFEDFNPDTESDSSETDESSSETDE
ncbi:DUF1980 domain-containing protein [bacterium]|nr:DUF1980 domain-containing protein [bacterium]